MSATAFKAFRDAIGVKNSEDISTSYGAITTRLNKDYWDSSSDSTHCLQAGSYGRRTAIHGVSDLDMVFELPWAVYDRISKVEGNGPSQLLQEVKKHLQVRYPDTDIKGDGQVVVVRFTKYVVEVLPAFRNDDGSYKYGNTHDGGSWPSCNPRAEIAAADEMNERTNRNYKHICKMLRAWKNEHGVAISGMLIDTLSYNFFKSTKAYDDKSYASYPLLVRDIFTFLANQPEQEYWLAPGSNARVAAGKFQRKAKKAAAKCQDALALDSEKQVRKERLWREVFGSKFPVTSTRTDEANKKYHFDYTEEFIEDKFPVDIQYELEVSMERAVNGNLKWLIERGFTWLAKGQKMRFYVAQCNVPGDYGLLWKVRNVGVVAEQKNMIRGNIFSDNGNRERFETSDFWGPHFVECYAVKDGVCVARDRIDVHIGDSE